VTSTLRQLRSLAPAPRSRIAVTVLLGSLTIMCGVGLMATAGYLISRAAERPAILSLTVAIVCVRAFGIARPLARYFERLSAHDLALRVLAQVRVRAYERMEPLAPAHLEGFRQGDLLSRMVADVDALQNLHIRGVGPPLVALVACTCSVGAAAAVLPAAALVLGAGLFVAGVVVPALALALDGRAGRGLVAARGELAAEVLELVRGAPELVVNGREDDRMERLRAADSELVRLSHRASLAEGVGDGLRLVVTGATVVGVLAAAVSATTSGRLDPVLIAMLTLLALASFEAVQPLAQTARELSETLAAGRRILVLTDPEPAVSDPDHPAVFPTGPFAVALEDVRVRYAPMDAPVLDGVSLRLEPGQRIALIGPSGAGKTTVVNLLHRFLDPECGRVTVAGRDIREFAQEDVRGAIAVASQDAHLFSTSIRENVVLARPTARDDEIDAALRDAGILPWVRSLPAGWDTPVGEEGHDLSGGQRQRVAVARALLADAPVLVLDEPTAHLDPAAAERLIDDVVACSPHRSILLITHRPEGLEHMHEILAIDGDGHSSATGHARPGLVPR
jgi:ATP-binding cassette, subfamily C, bacterial CydC